MTMLVPPSRDDAVELPDWNYRTWVVAVGGALVTVLALLGIRFVFHGYLFADDEFSAWFQAEIFARGKLTGGVPTAWCPYTPALTPTSIYSSAPRCSWWLSYLPLHSLMQAPFIRLGVGRLGVPLLSGLSVWLVASIARKAWPDKPMRPYGAALFMVTSTQILFMSMSMFSMPTHLFFSLLWLWLYVDDRLWSNVVMPFVGVLAVGVHSPFPHLLLIPPFVLRYLWNRRFVMFGYVVLAYGVGLMYWTGYIAALPQTATVTTVAAPGATAAVALHIFSLPSAEQGLVTSMHLALVASWNAPIAIISAIAAVLSWRRLDDFSRDAVLSILVIVAARLLKPTPQGQGWGYRYIYDGLASLALLSAIGFEVLAISTGKRRALGLVLASSLIMLIVQIPARAAGVASIVGPYQRGFAWMSTRNVDAVIFPSERVRWGNQLVRNDPFLRNRPKILNESSLSRDQLRALESAPNLTILRLTRDSLTAHGFPSGIVRIGSSYIVE
ncbi:MAG TPA: hypothetical protein VHB25_00305 [Gemmatimonadaceae bacterium]|nr:hypothetical protein [Gemmatimonadaceae bacterium]